MSFLLHGVHVPHRKNTADQPARRIIGVEHVTIPTLMHIGNPAVPIVKVGDTVKVGSKIAESVGAISSPIHASVSGKVTKISDIRLTSGGTVPAITIESDGEMSVSESVKAPKITSRQELVEAIRESGVVGLGGAGFPTHAKWNIDPSKIDELIINGAECEPYITSDSLTMTEHADDILLAICTLKKYFPIKRIIIGIEYNKAKAIESMKAMAEKLDNCTVMELVPRYPQGGEKVLVYRTTGKIIPTGKLPIDASCIVCNCTTVAAIGIYLATGMPLVEKCVTVDGGAVKEPQNIIVPIGTSVGDVLSHCGGLKAQPGKVLYGGPMMGITVPDLSAPVLKNTNAVIALTPKEAKLPKTTACIRCGACTNSCPFGLAPAEILLAYKKNDTEMLEKLSVSTCMLCGCCSYICPANRPLVQTNALAKQMLKHQNPRRTSNNG